MDVRANIKESITLKSLERILVPTGLKVAIQKAMKFKLDQKWTGN